MSKLLADSFINKYPVSKTLRFELKPIGRTKEYIERDGIIDNDTERAQNYASVKKIIDSYHKEFIEKALENASLKGLNNYLSYYLMGNKTEAQEKAFKKVEEGLRKEIVSCFKKREEFSRIFKKELIREDLATFVEENIEQKKLVESFYDFTSYFTGFHQNRENMYSPDEKSTAIAYRIINQNLPKYIDNMRIYDLIKCKLDKADIELLEDNLKKQYNDNYCIDDYFSIEGFNSVITQTGIDKYNSILGGYSFESGVKIQGLNELINLFNQKNKNDIKIPKLKPLFKQILSDRETISFVPVQFSSDEEMFDAIDQTYKCIRDEIFDCCDQLSLSEFISQFCKYDWNKIYIPNDTMLTDISQAIYGDWSVIRNAISYDYDVKNPRKKKNIEKYEDAKQKELKRIDKYTVESLDEKLEQIGVEKGKIQSHLQNVLDSLYNTILSKYDDYILINRKIYEENNKAKKSEKTVSIIKGFLDSLNELNTIIKKLAAGEKEAEKDELFYSEIARYCEALEVVTLLYNRVRNYVTQKPYSDEKIKLNFGKSTLLAGWDRNKERDNLGVLFRKNGLYYLGIMNRKDTSVIEKAPEASEDNEFYEKVDYKLLPGANKMLPKVFFSKSRIDEFAPSEEILRIRKEETFKKGDQFNLEDCHTFIDFFKASIEKHEEWSKFDFHFSDTSIYSDISGFYREVENQGYKLTFRKVKKTYIDSLVESGQLYLFQIYNKDFSPYSTGKPNLHTLYWKMLFDEDNLRNVVYKLNGEAEVFYRKSSIDEKARIIHPANIAIENKDPFNDKATSVFEYDLIKDRRYTVDKFQFHVPITMNFQAPGVKNINTLVNDELRTQDGVRVIGIDRGERNLLYISVVDCDGTILKQLSLNEIISHNGNNERKRNYHELLDKREKENKASRQNWTTINSIKELKEGYLSQVIHVITELMIEYNAIIVLEDLNFGFKRGRQKFEKQVYQKFEKMLIDKLNYYVDKSIEANKEGGLLRAYQLTEQFESFQKLGKQSGFLYYVPAWNTSKLDPTTGFVNLFYTKYESIEKTRTFIKNFDSIYYDNEQDMFAFEFDYNKFTYKAKESQTHWTVYTNGERIHHFRDAKKNNEWSVEYIQLAEEFKKLFNNNSIDYKNGDLQNEMLRIDNADFYKTFMYLFSLILQMRNSDESQGIDLIISPVINKNGEFFVSGNDNQLPLDADANGAYNIAKKGLLLIEKIRSTAEGEKAKLAITNQEWLVFAQEHVL